MFLVCFCLNYSLDMCSIGNSRSQQEVATGKLEFLKGRRCKIITCAFVIQIKDERGIVKIKRFVMDISRETMLA